MKVLNHALSSEEGKENCAKFVDILGLRTIFPLFMKTPKKQKRKGMSAEEYEGRTSVDKSNMISLTMDIVWNVYRTRRVNSCSFIEILSGTATAAAA